MLHSPDAVLREPLLALVEVLGGLTALEAVLPPPLVLLPASPVLAYTWSALSLSKNKRKHGQRGERHCPHNVGLRA